MMLAKAMIGLFATGVSCWASVFPPADTTGGMTQQTRQQETVEATKAKSTESVATKQPVASNAEAPDPRSNARGSEAVGGGTDGQATNAKPAFRGRLPRYYSAVVTPTQRSEIYSIQKRYRTQLEALELQLAELKQRERAEVSEVLDASQQKYVAEQMSKAIASRSSSQ